MSEEGSTVQFKEQKLITRKTSDTGRWVSFDKKGGRHTLDLDKYAITKRVKIHARDLRILDPTLSYPSTILGREGAIVLNLEHIKAIITAEEVLLRDPSNDNMVPIVEQLQRRLAPSRDHIEGWESPFEFQSLEVILEATCSFLDARTTELQVATYPALDELTSKMSSHNLDRVRRLKIAITKLTNRVQKVMDELEQILNDEDYLGVLYLSRKFSWSSFYASGEYPGSSTIGSISKAARASIITMHDDNDIEELEMLLEAHYMEIQSTMEKLTTLRKYINATEDYINIRVLNSITDTLPRNCTLLQLDNQRNQLIQLELFVSSATFSLSIYSLVTAIFGMNIPFTWEENHGYMFKWVVIITGIVCGILLLLIMAYARRKGLTGFS